MATKKAETISETSPVAPEISKYETALREIAAGDALAKNDISIQIAIKALQQD